MIPFIYISNKPKKFFKVNLKILELLSEENYCGVANNWGFGVLLS